MTDEFECESHTILGISYMLVTGELNLGFAFYGPFDTPTGAGQWAEKNLKVGVSYYTHVLKDVRED